MTLKAIVDDVSGVPEAVRSFYTKVEGDDAGDLAGKFRLNVEAAHGFSLDNIDGLKAALSTARGNRRKDEARFREFDGIDPIEARKALDQIARLGHRELWGAADKLIADQVKALEAEAEARRGAHRQKADAREATLLAALGEATVDHAVRAALAAAGGNYAIMGRVVTDRLRMMERDDGFHVAVVDADGNPRIKDAGGTPVLINDFVSELRADPVYAVAFSAPDTRRPVPPPRSGGYTRKEWTDKLGSADDAGRKKLMADYMAGRIVVEGNGNA